MLRRIDFYYFLTLGLILYTLVGFPSCNHKPKAHPSHNVTRQQLASHATIFREDGEDLGLCTSTAIGPHAFIVAAHCDESEDADTIHFDLATEDHHIIAITDDGRDHRIYLIDGTPFKNFVLVHQVVSTVGEVETIYGVGGAAYPPVAKYGVATACEDPSDLDAASGIQCSTIPVIPGDSGSAIYNNKAEIVGLVTYHDGSVSPSAEIGFALNFPQAQLDKAATFSDEDIHQIESFMEFLKSIERSEGISAKDHKRTEGVRH